MRLKLSVLVVNIMLNMAPTTQKNPYYYVLTSYAFIEFLNPRTFFFQTLKSKIFIEYKMSTNYKWPYLYIEGCLRGWFNNVTNKRSRREKKCSYHLYWTFSLEQAPWLGRASLKVISQTLRNHRIILRSTCCADFALIQMCIPLWSRDSKTLLNSCAFSLCWHVASLTLTCYFLMLRVSYRVSWALCLPAAY